MVRRTVEAIGQLPESLLRTSLLYAFHADTRLDIEGLARKFENHKKLSDATMTIAEELIAKGKAEGELRGRMIGKIQLLEFKLGQNETPDQELTPLETEELRLVHQTLQRPLDERT